MKKRTSLKSTKATHSRPRRIEGFEVLENECIWMKAGVINYRLCDHAYDCNNCPFDTGWGWMATTIQKKSLPVGCAIFRRDITARHARVAMF